MSQSVFSHQEDQERDQTQLVINSVRIRKSGFASPTNNTSNNDSINERSNPNEV
jgi:hypothetical protein